MSEINKRINASDMIIGGLVGTIITGSSMLIAKSMIENSDPTPKLEVSNKPDEVVFQAGSDSQIQKGIAAAIEVCKFKNAQAEQGTESKTTVKVGCEQGTLKTATVVIPTSGQQGK